MTQTNDITKRIEELENVRALRELVDNFSILADKKEVWKQTELFTKDATVESYVNGALVSSLKGTKQIGEAFGAFLANFETVYHMNGQHVVEINEDKAEGTLYCRVDLISSENGQWLIAKRTSNFVWNDRQELNQ
jgi:hypothetical protein